MSKVGGTIALVSILTLASHVSADAQQPECASSQQAMLMETVLDRTTRVPLAGANISASWRDNEERSSKVRTDSLGKASFCAPTDRLITLHVSYRNTVAPLQTVMLNSARETTQTIALDAPYVLVRGVVLDDATGQPVANGALRVHNTRLAVLTDANGKFLIERLPIGDYTLQVEHIAYATSTVRLSVNTEDLDATIRVLPAAVPLQPITVVAFSQRLEDAGFYDRKKRGIGTFYTHKQLEGMKAQFGSDLLRQVPSMLQVPQPSRRYAPRNYTIGRGNCRYRFIVDGTRTLPDFEMDNIQPQSVEGIEIYNGLSEIPTVFRPAVDAGSGTCGVIVVWTKNGS